MLAGIVRSGSSVQSTEEGGFGLVRLMRVLVVLAVVGSVLAPSSDVGSDAVAAQTVGGDV